MSSNNKEVTKYGGEENNKNNNDKYNNNNGGQNNPSGKKINLPNKLTIFRILIVPVFMFFILIDAHYLGDWAQTWAKIFAAALFLIAAVTDLIDGILARRLNLVTTFGIFMDAVADKFLIVGAMIAITASPYFEEMSFWMAWATMIVFFRELAVTSIRLIANSSDGKVISANILGKIKTFSQCVCIMTILLEDAVITQRFSSMQCDQFPPYLFSYITMIVMCLLTVYSGFVYIKSYWKYIDPAK